MNVQNSDKTHVCYADNCDKHNQEKDLRKLEIYRKKKHNKNNTWS